MGVTEPAGPPPAPAPRHAPAAEGPIALDGLVYGIDLLDALLVIHLGDAHLYASWVNPTAGMRVEDVVVTLRDLYRVGQFASRRLTGADARRADAPSPLITFELPHRLAVLRRVRAYAVAAVFDGAMPLGMARLVAARLASSLEPELPLAVEVAEPARPRPAVQVPPPPADAPRLAPPRDDAHDRAPHTLNFGSGPRVAPVTGLPRRSNAPPRSPEVERVGRLIAYLEAHAPEPHVARTRLALRAGLTLAALANPEALGPEAVVLIETAVQDILGVDRAELRGVA